MTTLLPALDLAQLDALDARDPLAHKRAEFDLPGTSSISTATAWAPYPGACPRGSRRWRRRNGATT
ncbi:hypothetical protein MSS93_15100 [Deinococcus radiodurans]|nr:hypothetical protein MSS93_15100 [Deinococcus radiodurans]